MQHRMPTMRVRRNCEPNKIKRRQIVSDASQTLGEFIRATRERRGISLRELARRAGISAPFLSEIERDRRNPSDDIAVRLAAELDVPVKELRALNAVVALDEFKRMMEKDRDLGVAFAGMVRALKNGKISTRLARKKLAVK